MADQKQFNGVVNFKNSVNVDGDLKKTGADTATAASVPDGYGVHEIVIELDFDGKTPTATDNGMIKTVATLPAQAVLVDANVMCTETFVPNQTLALDLVSTATAVSADVATTAVVQIIDNISLATSAVGTAGKGAIASNLGLNTTGVTVALINRGTGNTTTILTAGKVLVYLRYIGSAAPVVLTTL